MSGAPRTAVADFQELHREGCFILPNPWDVGTAIYLHHLGFQALATTSAGFAFSRGKPDGFVPRDEMLVHIGEVVAATPLPVNADFLNGFADRPEEVAANVGRCLATGVAGLSIEDSTGQTGQPLYEQNLAIDRIRAARAAIDDSDSGVVLTARCEAFLVDHPEPLEPSWSGSPRTPRRAPIACTRRGSASRMRSPRSSGRSLPSPSIFSSPGLIPSFPSRSCATWACAAFPSAPVLALAAWGAFLRSAREMANIGNFKSLAEGARTPELNDLFSKPQK